VLSLINKLHFIECFEFAGCDLLVGEMTE